ncbi:hypothetical protein ACGFX4_40605 [Kitasatospora sp. NPDC048365]|uniref:hypothetical protein n=1 Tax=Kitasatospora sp. NPDC048365 TaxID=3364050 RepID=UPI00372374D3
MNVFGWVCSGVLWAVALGTAVPAVVRGRAPRWWPGVVSPRLWGAGQLLFAAGGTYGMAAAGHETALWPLGGGIALAGLGLMEWSRRTRPDSA